VPVADVAALKALPGELLFNGVSAYVIDTKTFYIFDESLVVGDEQPDNPPVPPVLGGSWALMAQRGSSGGGITEAPIDGTPYARQDSGWASVVSDMAKAVYDPNTVEGDAFDMDNMVEGTDTKILTASERALIPLAGTALQPGDIDDTPYGASWDGNNDAATKNVIYDKLEALGGASVPDPTGKSSYTLKVISDAYSLIKNNFSESSLTKPGASDDNTVGYYPGSVVYHTIYKRFFMCVSSATGAAVWNRLSNYQPVVTTSDPTVTNDSANLFDYYDSFLGVLWINTSNGKVFVCVDESVGAAVWVEVSATGSGSSPVKSLDALGTQASSATWDHDDGADGFTLTLSGNAAVNAPANPPTLASNEISEFYAVITQNGTGGYSPLFNSVFKNPPSVGQDPDAVTSFSGYYNGTDYICGSPIVT